MGLSSFVHSLGSFGHRIITKVEYDIHYIQDKDHRDALVHHLADIAKFGEFAIPVLEKIMVLALPAEAMPIHAIEQIALKADLRVKAFAEKPTWGSLLAIGGDQLREAVRAQLPKLVNGVTIAGQLIEDEQQLDAISPAVFQGILGAHAAAYVASAGNVDLAIQSALSDLAAAAAQQPVPLALTQPSAGT